MFVFLIRDLIVHFKDLLFEWRAAGEKLQKFESVLAISGMLISDFSELKRLYREWTG